MTTEPDEIEETVGDETIKVDVDTWVEPPSGITWSPPTVTIGDEASAVVTPTPFPADEPVIVGPVYACNISDETRSWNDLHSADGHVLKLDPGEEKLMLEAPDGPISHLSVRAAPGFPASPQ